MVWDGFTLKPVEYGLVCNIEAYVVQRLYYKSRLVGRSIFPCIACVLHEECEAFRKGPKCYFGNVFIFDRHFIEQQFIGKVVLMLICVGMGHWCMLLPRLNTLGYSHYTTENGNGTE